MGLPVSNTDMKKDAMPKYSASALFLVTASVTLGTFLRVGLGHAFWWLPLAYIGAGIVVLRRPRLGYCLALAATVAAVRLVSRTLAYIPWRYWTDFNYEPIGPLPPELAWFAQLRLLSAILVLSSGVCALVRLLPSRWTIRGIPVAQCNWPVIAATVPIIAAWFLLSVTFDRGPRMAGGTGPMLRILHLKKNGIHYEESSVEVFQDSRTLVSHASRRLFQYRFEHPAHWVTLGEKSPAALDRARALTGSPKLWGKRTPAAVAPRSWNAEGWYVARSGSPGLAFTTENGLKPPPEVTSLFYEIEALPSSAPIRQGIRDVCLGFCYDPVGGLVPD
jgi:hypothetical protein